MLTEAEFRTDALQPGDRFAGWQQYMNNTIAPMEITSSHADDFWADHRLLRIEDTLLWPARLHASCFRRTPRLIRQSDPGLLHMTLVLPGSGAMHVEQGRVRSAVEAHDLYFLDTSRPSGVWTDGQPIVGVGVDIPRSLLPLPMDTCLDEVLGRRLSGRHGFGALLTQFVTHLVDRAEEYGPADVARLHRVLLDLAAGALAGELDRETALPPEARTGNLVLAIRSFIGSNFHDPGLTPGTVAAAHYISTRQLHRLFHREGTTVAALIRSRRLERARLDLADPRLVDTPVQTIAARCGFGAPAHFSRVFRAAQGMSPRDYREARLRERTDPAR
ncbi:MULTISPECIES: AraC family transcriptional regulator [Streptomyces]|uniref:AraC family transcriptional regulator n=1 Tax=Streptomyces TaxID=1883 RepID=UPI0002F2B020|nr:AraC family transcriptional regulator [Streptomyces griseus]MYR10073.1 helix-turn-helix domain-containing protein [Streptomyces sp. SID724]MBW3709417.1 AraC family transcriptional regulator [Streptomyces griseus]NEB53037.1 AraC family transcriptional regulator [Streptomyces griseus]SEE30000.1 AraC-type DNA-binding protein [Streptomyces griseus]SQA25285.1 AraC family transcriptional regulator [Streptomyces griseus]